MKKGFRRRISDALGWTRPSTVMIEGFDFPRLLSSSDFHKDLSEKQVLYLEQMISNYRNRNMAICRCDVERVLDMCKEVEIK